MTKVRVNRLAKEKSPYLLQHANNPVDWYPWGDEAFEKAKKEDKPIFLSIGYSTCHWCHVMEEDSFEDEEVARLMNRAFVAIKVDREERPDIDNIYMSVCQLMTGSGGWPLNVVMTPTKKPFFAATYIPKQSRFGRTGMLDLIPRIEEAWHDRRKDIEGSADRVTAVLREEASTSKRKELGIEVLHRAFGQLASSFDHTRGGFGRGMKFPTPHQLLFLLRYWKRTGSKEALEMVEKTLESMSRGGIFDHVGFGFHRYSTDPDWHVPHFEKMLYDQALLLIAYTEAYQATGKEIYSDTARKIVEYVLRDMTSAEGAFFSAEDADSEGEEGRFYVWTLKELESLLDETTASLFTSAFGVTAAGNFLNEVGGERNGLNILHLKEPIEAVAAKHGLSAEEVCRRLDQAQKALFAARNKRVRPFRDDKVLTDWNGLMIGALALASRVLGEPAFVQAAVRAAKFLLDKLKGRKGRLLHRYRDGEAGLTGHLDDYAFFIFGLIELYETTFDPVYLEEAQSLNALLLTLFWDEYQGGFFLTADGAEEVLVRAKEISDGAIPSGNSVSLHNFVRLARITGDARLDAKADEISTAFGGEVMKAPTLHTFFLSALDFALGPSVEVVISGDPNAEDTRVMLEALCHIYAPNKVVILRPEDGSEEIAAIAPFVAHQPMKGAKATAYVCVEQSCSFPTTDLEAMVEMVRRHGELKAYKSPSQ